jgi:hypothetical protein
MSYKSVTNFGVFKMLLEILSKHISLNLLLDLNAFVHLYMMLYALGITVFFVVVLTSDLADSREGGERFGIQWNKLFCCTLFIYVDKLSYLTGKLKCSNLIMSNTVYDSSTAV